jgi:hypothetical protein
MGIPIPIKVPSDSKIAYIAGSEKSSFWGSGQGEPVNGWFILSQITQYSYQYSRNGVVVNYDIIGVDVSIAAINPESQTTFGYYDFPDGVGPYINNRIPFSGFQGGYCYIFSTAEEANNYSFGDDIELIGDISDIERTFFEPMPLASGDTRRYARTDDGTRVYIKREAE